MDLDRDEVAHIADAKITERFRNIGIYDQGDAAQETTRSNFKYLNEQREARDTKSVDRKTGIKRTARDVATSIISNGLWALIVIAAVFFASLLHKGTH